MSGTERPAAERGRHDGEPRFRTLIEEAGDTVAILAPDGRVVYHSPSVTRMLGFEVEELVGGDPFELIHPDDVDGVRAEFADLLGRPGEAVTVEYRHAHKDGGWRVLESLGRNLLDDPAIDGVIVVTRDITVANRLAERRRGTEKLEAVGRLAGGIAHDFNNILTVIQGHAQLLRSRFGEEWEGSEDVREILRSADRAATLTRQLLAFGRRQVLRPERIDLGKAIEGSKTMLRRLVGEDIELVCEAGPDLWPVRADREQIEQVIVNLVVNARQAMPEGGTIRVEAFNEALDDRRVVLRVADDGIGMEAAIVDRIFEPFFTTREHGRGTGLGLATVYGTVEQSGAKIDVDSRPGEGAVFEIRFPAAVDEAEREEPASRESRPATERRILVIEDEESVRRLAERVLQRTGYRVLTAESGEEAIEVLEAHDGPVDLVVSDVVLPGIDGYRTALRLRERYPGLEVLHMSGHMEDEVVRRGVASAGDRFLAKPFTPTALLEKVAEILDRSG